MIDVVVTGASGFVGINFTKHFQNHEQVAIHALNLRRGISSGDLATADVVIHLAGKAHDLKKTSDDNEYFRVNTELTKALFDHFMKSSARDFIYFSSVKAVADTVKDILTEDAIANPLTPYGRSKFHAEQYLQSHSMPAGKRLFILRPCMIHGPGNKGNLNLLYQVVSKGIPYPLASFHNSRSFLSVSNLCYVTERLISDQTISGGVYNLADDEALSTNEVITVISEALGRGPKLLKINAGLIKGLARLGDKLHLPLNSERLTKLTENYVVSNAKIKEALKIENFPTTSKEGLARTIKSFIAS
jgi:nucleoside-diphosphate-sugar epimerase